jgi:hypothetical protein
MSDYIPNPGPGPGPGGMPGGPYDPQNRFEPPDPAGNGPYVLLAILVAVAVIGGVVYFSHGHGDRSHQQAQAPMTTTTMPIPARPAEPLLPRGTTPDSTIGKDTLGTDGGGRAVPDPTTR